MKFVKVIFSNEETQAADRVAQAIIFHYKSCHWWELHDNLYILQTYDSASVVAEKISPLDDLELEGLGSLNLKVVSVLPTDPRLPLDARLWMDHRTQSKAELLHLLQSNGVTWMANKKSK